MDARRIDGVAQLRTRAAEAESEENTVRFASQAEALKEGYAKEDAAAVFVADLQSEKNELIAALASNRTQLLEVIPPWDVARAYVRGLEQQYRVGFYGQAAPGVPTTVVGGVSSDG